MCVIIDNDIAHKFFAQHEEFKPVLRWLLHGNGRLVFGGKLTQELQANALARKLLIELKRAGRADTFPEEQLNTEEDWVKNTCLCRSNDTHVIALARVSKARTLCTQDHALMEDFKNLELVPRPQGKIYSRPDQAHLLNHDDCGWKPSK